MAMKKWYTLGLAAAIAFCFSLPQAALGAESETIVIKEKATASDTVVGDKIPNAADGLEPATKPFSGGREMLPAGTALTGEQVVDGKPMVDVVNYASTVAKRTPNELVLNTTISKIEDEETLSRLAHKVYMENDGPKYQNVTIFWHIGQNPEPLSPWARTDIAKGDTVYEIIKIKQR